MPDKYPDKLLITVMETSVWFGFYLFRAT